MQIKSINVENFKALRASGTVRLKPLSVIIGNNGSGKSSLMEAIETYVRVTTTGVDAAMEHWQGFEHIRHKAAQPRQISVSTMAKQPNAMKFALNVKVDDVAAKLQLDVNTFNQGNLLYIQREFYEKGLDSAERTAGSTGITGVHSSNGLQPDVERALKTLVGGKSLLPYLGAFDKITLALGNMLFLRLNPDTIGQLQSVKRTERRIQLASDGANIAEYLIDLRDRSSSAFEDITRALQYVLPYASDVEPKVLDAGVLRRSYVQLLEDKYEIPGWLMSSGSLRVLPLIATLLDPEPPPVVFIEEVENGLDPRTVGLVVDLMRSAAKGGKTQVIATTHSPYLLDMLDLDDVLLCERSPKGPAFSWPASRKEMKAWRDRFLPGKLYTMSALQHEPEASVADDSPQQGEVPKGGWGEDE